MILIGKICGAVGLKGEIKLSISSDFQEYITKNFKNINFSLENSEVIKIELKRVNSKFLICKIEGVCDRTSAENIGKPNIFCKKDQLPELTEDEFYNRDLIGLGVYENDELIGKVRGVVNFGAGDIIEIEKNDGEIIMYPFLKTIFVDIKKDCMQIKTPKFS